MTGADLPSLWGLVPRHGRDGIPGKGKGSDPYQRASVESLEVLHRAKLLLIFFPPCMTFTAIFPEGGALQGRAIPWEKAFKQKRNMVFLLAEFDDFFFWKRTSVCVLQEYICDFHKVPETLSCGKHCQVLVWLH